MYGQLVPTAHFAWATFFHRRGLTWLPRLTYAYRAPMLFGGAASESGLFRGVVGGVDERARAGDYDGRRTRKADRFDLLYVGAHGRLRSHEFELLFHDDEWRPASAGLDGNGPRIAVFDACDLFDPADPDWGLPWVSQMRPNLRLVLGFGSLATISRGSALRGEEFAERLDSGQPVVTAWIGAVKSCSAHRRDRPVAIGFGRDEAEADTVLHDADLKTITALPALSGDVVVKRRG